MTTDSSSSKEPEKTNYDMSVNEVPVPIESVMSPSGRIVEFGDEQDVDEAMEFAKRVGHIEVSPKEDNKVRRKIDFVVMPLFSLLYMVQFMDKTCIGFAAIMGIKEDYAMEGQMYSWTTSCFYLGYLFGCFFSSWILQKLPTVKTVSFFIVLWGIVQCLHCLPKTYAVFVFLRTLLGVLEAFVTPIFVILLNQYYRYSEHFGRVGIFYGSNGAGTIFLSAVSYGLYYHEASYTIEGYKVLFIIIGLMTSVLGLAIMVIMPNTPDKAWWLNDREKAVVLERIRDNEQGFGNKKIKWKQVKECFTDPKTWLYFMMSLSVGTPNSGVSSYGTIILNNMGYSTIKALLMKMPSGAFELIGLAILPTLSRVVKSRMILGIAYMIIVLIGVCLLAFAPSNTAQMVGLWIYGMSPVGITLVTSCVSSNTAGHTKKLLTNAITLAAYAAGNTIGPQTFQSTDAPHYPKAKAGVVGCISASIGIMFCMYATYYYENKKRDKFKESMGDAYQVPENVEFADLTDLENPEFRYRT